MKTNFDVTIVDELINLEKHIAESLTSETNYPLKIQGKLDIYDSELTITMSNNDIIQYKYKCFPYRLTSDIHTLTVNNKTINLPEFPDSVPALQNMIKQTYHNHKGV